MWLCPLPIAIFPAVWTGRYVLANLNRGTECACPGVILSVNILDPSDGFGVADFSQVPLSGRKIRMPEDDLAHNFERRAGSGCIGYSMSTEIMRVEFNSNPPSRCFGHSSGCGIADRKYGLVLVYLI
jgi:hypothetical protein